MSILTWWKFRQEERQREAEQESKRIELYAKNQRVEGYQAKDKYYRDVYRDGKWGEGARIGFSSVEATNVFYRVLAEQGKPESTLKILASPQDLEALSMEEFAPSPLGVMAVKRARLSLFFRDAAEQQSPNGQAVLKITKDWAEKIEGFKNNLFIGIISADDFQELKERNIESFTAANVSPNVDGYMHAFKVQRSNGNQVAEFFSLEEDGKFSGVSIDRDITEISRRVQAISLDNI
ncbi:MAG: hypothetical protein IT559_06495 [Alphaproteobacteria bacterium]|nr:hypothetical protein [Alphaproteobacteria bacterium]